MNATSHGGSSQYWLSRNRWLWWKEFRLLMPLVIMLVIVALLVFIATLFWDTPAGTSLSTGDIRWLIPVIFPMLMSVGAGAVLVGQEREQRTMEWMATLPLAPRQWILVKLLVAMIGLMVVWCVSLVCLWWLDDGSGPLSRWRQGNLGPPQVRYSIWWLHSIYLTLCGFYASWRIRDAFLGIVTVVALAFLPLVITELIRWPLDTRRLIPLNEREIGGLSYWVLMPAIVWIAWLGDRAAKRVLLPQPAEQHRTLGAVSPTRLPSSFWSTAPSLGSPWGAMIWQSVRSTPTAWLVILGMIVLGFAVPILFLTKGLPGSVEVLIVLFTLAVPVGCSWLGVLVFQNDGSAARVRFLADRGVSPTKIYLARHAVPLSALAGCLLLYNGLALRRLTMPGDDAMRAALPSLLAITLIAWIIYSVSQWTSQLFRTFVLSVIVSPIVALMALAWLIFAGLNLDTPWWILVVISLLPMLATWWLMPRFIDLRDRPWSFVIGFFVVLIAIGLPVAEAAWRVTRIPVMPSQVRRELLAEGVEIRRQSPSPIEIRIAPRQHDVFGDQTSPEFTPSPTLDQVIRYVDAYPTSPSVWIPALRELRKQPERPATIDTSVLNGMIYRLNWETLRFRSDQDWESFSAWIEATAELAGALRQSVRWSDQDAADVLEGWVAETLHSEPVSSFANEPSFRRAVEHLFRKADRNRARRHALLATWAGHGRSVNEAIPDLGSSSGPPYLVRWTALRRIEAIVATALSATESNGDDWLEQMHHWQIGPETSFEYGPYSPRYRELPVTVITQPNRHYPAMYWGMPWETIAEQLILEHRP